MKNKWETTFNFRPLLFLTVLNRLIRSISHVFKSQSNSTDLPVSCLEVLASPQTSAHFHTRLQLGGKVKSQFEELVQLLDFSKALLYLFLARAMHWVLKVGGHRRPKHLSWNLVNYKQNDMSMYHKIAIWQHDEANVYWPSWDEILVSTVSLTSAKFTMELYNFLWISWHIKRLIVGKLPYKHEPWFESTFKWID